MAAGRVGHVAPHHVPMPNSLVDGVTVRLTGGSGELHHGGFGVRASVRLASDHLRLG
jgi:hypothetical protein